MGKFLFFFLDRNQRDSQEELSPHPDGNTMSPVGSWPLPTSCNKSSTRTKQDDIKFF